MSRVFHILLDVLLPVACGVHVSLQTLMMLCLHVLGAYIDVSCHLFASRFERLQVVVLGVTDIGEM